jgi:hypothetical protein
MSCELDQLDDGDDEEERLDEFGCKKTLIGLVLEEQPVIRLNVR